MLFLTEADVRRHLPMREAIRLMRETFEALGRGEAVNQPRRRLYTPAGSALHQMGGAIGKYHGTKYYSVHLKYGFHFFFHLFDSITASSLALMEANHLGQIRTGAASGYATDLLARADAGVLAVIGSGFQARAQVEAISMVRKLCDIRVWSRNSAKREAFAQEVGARATATAEEAVRGCDILVTATFAKDPVVESTWVSPGTHINAMGSNRSDRQEIPGALFGRAAVIAVDSLEQAKLEADYLPPRTVELTQATRKSSDEITIFKSLGLGVEDVAAGGYVYEQFIETVR